MDVREWLYSKVFAHSGSKIAAREASYALEPTITKLVEALQSLPLEYFDKDMDRIDAADFVDNSEEFYTAMVKAREALAELERTESILEIEQGHITPLEQVRFEGDLICILGGLAKPDESVTISQLAQRAMDRIKALEAELEKP